MRIMGLDYGDKTVGVAISDGLLITAQPIETVVRERPNKLRKTYQRLEALIAEYEVGKLVVGMPYNMNGTEGERAKLCVAFAEELSRRTGLPYEMVDERLTTVEADEILAEMKVAPSERKEYIDKIAASIILQSYLDNMSR